MRIARGILAPVVVVQRGLSVPVNLAALVVRPVLRVLGSARWRRLDLLPPTGGGLVVANHVSLLDPVTLMDCLLAVGPTPRILAKQSLFEVFWLGAVLRGLGAVPVLRGTTHAVGALRAAEAALRNGDRVVMYPDGTLTKDPQGWPMIGRTGAARLALSTGVPVIPVAQWGAQQLLPRVGRPRLWPRPHLDVMVGAPVDLSAFVGRPLTGQVLREATEVIVDALVALLEDVRGERAPARWDPRTSTRRAA